MCFDAEPPEYFDVAEPVARKEHRCCECHVVIGRGEKYERCSGKWSGEFQSFATCGQCCELRQKVVEHEKAMGCDGSEAWPPFGGLWQALHDMEYEEAMSG